MMNHGKERNAYDNDVHGEQGPIDGTCEKAWLGGDGFIFWGFAFVDVVNCIWRIFLSKSFVVRTDGELD